MKLKVRPAQATVSLQQEDIATEEFEALVPYPKTGPCSYVRTGLTSRKSQNYQSVEMTVSIEAPCNPGEESAAAEICFDKLAELVEKYADARDELLASLE